MFFKPFKGLCSCHALERWVLNKKGECSETIKARKTLHTRSRIKPNNSGQRFEKSGGKIKQSNFKKQLLDKVRGAYKKKSKPIQYRRKPTGEGALFKEIYEEAAQKSFPDAPKCACCPNRIWQPAPINFSHLLAKGGYPAFRLRKENIWLCCERCHREWETTDRSHPKFTAKLAEYERLKTLYYAEKRLPKYDSSSGQGDDATPS